jgi:hypothetical protein
VSTIGSHKLDGIEEGRRTHLSLTRRGLRLRLIAGLVLAGLLLLALELVAGELLLATSKRSTGAIDDAVRFRGGRRHREGGQGGGGEGREGDGRRRLRREGDSSRG